MPEMTFVTRWPDGRVLHCYSPSLVMHDYLSAGEAYPVPEFVERSTTALTEASDRVKAKYGMACSAAAATLAQIRATAQQCAEGDVVVESMRPAAA